MANLQTIVQYITLIVSLIAGFLLITSISQQDWMREEMSMRIPREMFDTVKNLSSSMLPSGESAPKQQLNQVLGMVDGIPSDVSLEMNTHSGLLQTCLTITMDGFENPMKLLIPEIKWCCKNDLVLEPTKYGLPDIPESIPFDNFKTQSKALDSARICVIMAIFCLALTVTILILKVFKWQKESVIVTSVLVLISCICIVAALALVSSNFALKKTFENLKRYSMDSTYSQDIGYSGRRRRESPLRYPKGYTTTTESPGYGGRYATESLGYGGKYPSEGSQHETRTEFPIPDFSQWEVKTAGGDDTGVNDGGIMGEAMAEMLMGVLSTLEIKESVGSPLIMAGLSIGLILLATILNGVEFYLIRKHGGIEVKYQNVEMS